MTSMLKSFIKALPDESAREEFAAKCGITLGHLRNVMYGLRPCAPELASTIERLTDCKVMRWDLRPDDWHRIWPELVGKKGAPKVEASKARTA